MECVLFTTLRKTSLELTRNIHQQTTCATANDKRKEVPAVKTPGQRLRSQIVLSLTLEQQKMLTGTMEGPKFSLRGSKLWTKTV